MSLHVVKAGLSLSVQDHGRIGFRKFGVSAAGPMDDAALTLASALCGNPADAAALEFAGIGGQFKADTPLYFAVTGGDCDIRIGDQSLNAGETHRLNAGDILTVGALRTASWGYLAVSGGIQTSPVMGARSTHLRFGVGGLNGRALVTGDCLPLSETTTEPPLLRGPAFLADAISERSSDPIRIMLGPQDDYFATDVLKQLTNETFTVAPQRDRMATVLGGPTLPAQRGHDIVSDGTVTGAIQVPGSGHPIVLMAECQTTGGYPKIATVISADLARFAQLPTGSSFRFQIVDRTTAEDAARDRHAALQAALGSLTPKITTTLTSAYLLSCDLVGGIIAPDDIMGRDLATEQFT